MSGGLYCALAVWLLAGCAHADLGSWLGGGLKTVGADAASAARAVSGDVSSAASSVGAATKDVAGALGQELQKDVQTAKDPLDKTIAYIGSSQCQNVQKIFGTTYDQIKEDNEPDLNSLQLEYRTRNSKTIMNISAATAALRELRALDAGGPLLVYFHGFMDAPSKQSFGTLSQAFLDSGSTSVIALDASSLIRWLYIRAATYVRFIGGRLAELLAALVQLGLDPKQIHLVGHSLGAHIAGFTGKEFRRLTGGVAGRLSALDPAGPCFTEVPAALRLQRTDAAYVDVIHTDGGVYGLSDASGHKDYYPNSGSKQPDCVLQTCSHSRAWDLYSESVRAPHAFPAVRCKDWDAFKEGDCEWDNISYMGYSSQPGDEGKYFLQTGKASPYGLGLNGTKYVNNEGILGNAVNLAG